MVEDRDAAAKSSLGADHLRTKLSITDSTPRVKCDRDTLDVDLWLP